MNTNEVSQLITVYQPVSGWKAVHLVKDEDCGNMLVPWQTGMFAYATRAEAVAEGKQWARDLEIPFSEG